MSVKIVVGAQFGDEGKGKMVDYLAQSADLIVRFQGGDNAGHTVVNSLGAFKLHLIPCGIFEPRCSVLVGTGTVVNPDELLKEMDQLIACGVDLSRLYISQKAVILMPYHVDKDGLAESGKNSIGTTKRGIGPAYADKALRVALRFDDLLDWAWCEQRLASILPSINAQLVALGGSNYEEKALLAKLREWKEKLGSRIVDPVPFLHHALADKKNIIFEGQLGVMKDIDLGIYPYVTSSHPVAAYACVSSGIPMKAVDDIIGVAKAFSSAVGAGPFPTEMDSESANGFRGSGEHIDDEFGARTGRARRIGWLDLPVLKYATQVNGFTALALLKLDKLDQMETIQVCTGYILNDLKIEGMPPVRLLEDVKPVYHTLKGWKQSTKAIRRREDLPIEAKEYVQFVEQYLQVPVRYIGVGPDRDELVL